MAIRIHVSTHDEADAVWRALRGLVEAELHLDGLGLLVQISQRSALMPDRPAHTHPAESP